MKVTLPELQVAVACPRRRLDLERAGGGVASETAADLYRLAVLIFERAVEVPLLVDPGTAVAEVEAGPALAGERACCAAVVDDGVHVDVGERPVSDGEGDPQRAGAHLLAGRAPVLPRW